MRSQQVHIPVEHWPVEPERIVVRSQLARNGIHYNSARAATRHNAMPAVATVQVEAGDSRWSEVGAMVRSVGVLPRLQDQ